MQTSKLFVANKTQVISKTMICPHSAGQR